MHVTITFLREDARACRISNVVVPVVHSHSYFLRSGVTSHADRDSARESGLPNDRCRCGRQCAASGRSTRSTWFGVDVATPRWQRRWWAGKPRANLARVAAKRTKLLLRSGRTLARTRAIGASVVRDEIAWVRLIIVPHHDHAVIWIVGRGVDRRIELAATGKRRWTFQRGVLCGSVAFAIPAGDRCEKHLCASIRAAVARVSILAAAQHVRVAIGVVRALAEVHTVGPEILALGQARIEATVAVAPDELRRGFTGAVEEPAFVRVTTVCFSAQSQLPFVALPKIDVLDPINSVGSKCRISQSKHRGDVLELRGWENEWMVGKRGCDVDVNALREQVKRQWWSWWTHWLTLLETT